MGVRMVEKIDEKEEERQRWQLHALAVKLRRVLQFSDLLSLFFFFKFYFIVSGNGDFNDDGRRICAKKVVDG